MIQLIKRIFNIKSVKKIQAEQLYNEGILFANEKKYDEAIECFRKGIETDPKYSYSYNGIGNVYFLKKKYDEAIEFFDKALKIEPINSKFNTNIGICYISKNNFTNSVKYFRIALKKDPKNITAKSALNQVEEIQKYKNSFISDVYKLQDDLIFFCPKAHDYFVIDCSFCNTLHNKIIDHFETIEKSWLKLCGSFFNIEIREELFTYLRKSGFLNLIITIIKRMNTVDKYYEEDMFRYPMSEWGYNNISLVREQIVNNCLGITQNRCIENIDLIDVRNMFEDILYTFYQYKATKINNVFELYFRHKITGDSVMVFCYSENIEILDETPFYFKIMPFGIEENGVKITMSIKNKVIKLHTNNNIMGVKAEYAYMKQMFPNSNVKSQMLSTKTIDNFEVEVDILSTDNNEVVVFDISDFYGRGIGTIFSDLKK